MPTTPLAPLPDGRPAVISSGFGPRGAARVKHRGADMSYRAAPGDPPPRLVRGRVVYTAERTKAFYSPPGRKVRATEAGIVVQAKRKPGFGGDVWLHHIDSGRVTRYGHLASIAVQLGQAVTEGQELGVWGRGQGTPFVHLHFELLTAGKKNSQVDPSGYLASATPGAPAASARPAEVTSKASSATSAAMGGLAWLLLIGVIVSTRS